jgi:uncharacterized protein (DUF427 family)
MTDGEMTDGEMGSGGSGNEGDPTFVVPNCCTELTDTVDDVRTDANMTSPVTDAPAPPWIEPNRKWIRGTVGGATVVDSRRSSFVWERRSFPLWFFPADDIAAELRPASDSSPRRGERPGVVHHDLVVGDRVLPGAARSYPDSPDPSLADLVGIDWSAMDQWFEEETEVFVHPRSPYVRVDTLLSSRHVVVRVDGVVVADSTRPTLLFETRLPTRYYLPADDVRGDLLQPTATTTSCPYKGDARYWSLTLDGVVHENVAWGYDAPLPESADVTGLICFYNERVDIEVDGVAEDRPSTQFS